MKTLKIAITPWSKVEGDTVKVKKMFNSGKIVLFLHRPIDFDKSTPHLFQWVVSEYITGLEVAHGSTMVITMEKAIIILKRKKQIALAAIAGAISSGKQCNF